MPPAPRFPSLLVGSLAFAAFTGTGYLSGRALFTNLPSHAHSPDLSKIPAPPTEPPNPATTEIETLAALKPEDFPAMFDSLCGDSSDQTGQTLRLRMLFARWVKLAPEEGFALIRAHDDGGWLDTYLSEWAKHDPAAVEALLVRTQGDKEMKYAYSSLMEVLAARDPEAYFATRARHPEFGGMKDKEAFAELAKTNPARAAEIFASLDFSEIEDTNQAAKGLAKAWGRGNPSAALDWAWSLKNERGRESALNAALEGIAERDPHEAAKALAEFTMASGEKIHPLENFPSLVENAIASIVGKLAQEDFAAAVRWLDENVKEPSASLLEHAAKALPTDITSLHAVLSTVENPNLLRSLFYNTIVIPGTDTATYAQQAAALPVGAARDALLSHALATWARSDFASVSTFISEKAPALASDPTFLQNFLNKLTPEQSEQALALIKAGGPASLPSDFVRAVGNRNPAALAETIPSMPVGPGRAQATEALASQWVLAAPTSAAAWARGLAGADAEAAQRSLASSWARWDSYAASQWITELPRGTARDGAVTALIAEVTADEPDSAFAWAVTLDDATKRAASLRKSYQAWHASNPAQAAAALQAATLTPEEKARLTKP